MKFSTAIFIFFSKHWDAILASIAACIFISLFTRHSGIGISPDSVVYLSTATNIREHFSFTDFNGLPLVDFPLGYPSLLALISFLTGSSVISIVPVLNCFLFSGVIIMTSVVIEGYQKTSPLYKACFLALLACSPFLLEVYAMLWSETFFLFLILLFVVVMQHYFKTQGMVSLSLVACIVAMAFVTRYAGITLLGTGLFLIFFNGKIPFAKKIKHLLLFTLLGSSLAVANLMRNGKVSGNITGVREKALRSLSDNFQQIGATVSEWFPFLKGHETAATVLFIVILLLGIFILLYHALQQQYFASYETIIACFLVVYSAFIITIATLSRFENLSSRLLSPMYIPLLLVSCSWIISFVKGSVRIQKNIALIIVFFLYAGFYYNHYRLNAEAWEGIKDSGMPGYSEGSWTESPAVAFVKKNKSLYTQPIYSNANDAVYFLTGIHALPLPHKEIEKEKAAFLLHPSFYLIWFTDGDNPDLVDLNFIKKYKKQVSVQEVEGGAVYFFADSTLAIPPR